MFFQFRGVDSIDFDWFNQSQNSIPFCPMDVQGDLGGEGQLGKKTVSLLLDKKQETRKPGSLMPPRSHLHESV